MSEKLSSKHLEWTLTCLLKDAKTAAEYVLKQTTMRYHVRHIWRLRTKSIRARMINFHCPVREMHNIDNKYDRCGLEKLFTRNQKHKMQKLD
jgi:hypothetical protein